jgi:hypothetical protein
MMNEKVENLSRHQDGKIGFFIIDYPLLGDVYKKKEDCTRKEDFKTKVKIVTE